MIYQVIVGAEPIAHPEIQAFLKGFLLPCVNGFTFSEVSHSTVIPLILVLTLMPTTSLLGHVMVAPRHS